MKEDFIQIKIWEHERAISWHENEIHKLESKIFERQSHK